MALTSNPHICEIWIGCRDWYSVSAWSRSGCSLWAAELSRMDGDIGWTARTAATKATSALVGIGWNAAWLKVNLSDYGSRPMHQTDRWLETGIIVSSLREICTIRGRKPVAATQPISTQAAPEGIAAAQRTCGGPGMGPGQPGLPGAAQCRIPCAWRIHTRGSKLRGQPSSGRDGPWPR